MNYNNEPYPNNFDLLIQKCESKIDYIKGVFSNPNCLRVKDLYQIKNDKKYRVDDFLQKLNVECNKKLNGKEKKKNELTGLYVFGEMNISNTFTPIYVGISRSVFRRLYQHTWGKMHNQTSFSYLKAKERLGYKGKRDDLPTTELFVDQEKIRDYGLVLIPELKEYDLYFMKVYIAGRLKTKWNSFRTH